jgi:transposase
MADGFRVYRLSDEIAKTPITLVTCVKGAFIQIMPVGCKYSVPQPLRTPGAQPSGQGAPDHGEVLAERGWSVRAELSRKRLDELSRLEREIAAMDPRIEQTVRKTGTSLTSIPGVGPFIAAKILGEVGDPSRVRSKPAFAVLSGTAPLSASSRQVQRHRLNRGGNRQLNWALHYIALVQCRIMPEAQAYMARQREGGKSHKEAMRCLKRHLSNVVYRHLVADARRAELAA